MDSSISIKSSLARKFNYPYTIPLILSRVRWNWSSTASLEGNHKWITNRDFMNHKWRFSFSWYLPLDSDVIEYFKYEKKWVFSGKVCWNCSSNASEEAWSSKQKALKEDKLVYQTVKLYVGLSISLESSWACDVYFPIIMLVSILRMQLNQLSTASLENQS